MTEETELWMVEGTHQDHLGEVHDHEETLLEHLERIRRMTDIEQVRAEAVEAVIVNDGLAAALNDVLKRRGKG